MPDQPDIPTPDDKSRQEPDTRPDTAAPGLDAAQPAAPDSGSAAQPSSPAAEETRAERKARRTAEKKERRKKRPFILKLVGFVFKLAATIVALPVLALLVLAVVALIFRTDPAAHVPAGFDAYASVPSASQFATEVLHLKALDLALSSPDTASLRGTVRTLRANPVIRSRWFKLLADVRVDAALYPRNNFVAVADLGVRSALSRLLPLAAGALPGVIGQVEGLTWEPSAVPPRFSYRAGGMTVYAAVLKNLVIAASSPELLFKAYSSSDLGDRKALAKALGASGAGSLRFLADTASLTKSIGAQTGPMGNLVKALDFQDLSVVDLSLKDERVGVMVDLPYETDDKAVAALLARRSRTPAILTRLPASTAYFSLLAAGSPAELWANASSLLGPQAESAYQTASDASKLAFGLGVDELLFSWMGDELGVLGSDSGPAPVFFIKVKDERQRKRVFDELFGSLLVGTDLSTMVGDTRVPRIVFPGWLSGFLKSLGIDLPQPYYLVQDGIMYASTSAELVASCAQEVREGKLMVKTERWKETAQGISPESSVMLYYSLDRSAPFFLRGSAGLAGALKTYRRGVASLRLGPDGLRIELSAAAAGAPGLSELAGFPLKAPGRVDSDPVAARSSSGAPMAYWTSGRSVVAMDLSSGASSTLELDDKGYVVLDRNRGRLEAVWVVSGRGTVYRANDKLEALPGFPILTGYAVSAPPTAVVDTLYIPVSDEPAVLIVDAGGQTLLSDALHARSRSAPAASSWGVAVLPRSFDSQLYLLDPDGKLLAGWPVALDGIAGAAPVFAGSDSASGGMVAAVTEDGILGAWKADGSSVGGFPTQLYGVFDTALAWAPGWRSFFLVSTDGTLWRVGSDGFMAGSLPLKRGAAADSSILAFDGNGDGREELYVAGGGDALYAYSGDLTPLPGYPVSGTGLPAFVDVDGDGRADLVVRGADHTIHAYND